MATATHKPDTFPELLTPEMVCEIAPGFTPASLAQLRYSGKGAKFVKFCKRVFYRREDIEEWINSNIQTMTGAA